MPRLSPGHHQLWPNVHTHVFDAASPGPTALMQAGIHGDEVAGVHALQELLEEGIRPKTGRLIVVPIMNPPAYRARERAQPNGLDLNRQFPGDASGERYEEKLAAIFMKLVCEEKVDLMATLHESKKRYDPAVVPSFGQTLVYGVDPCPPILDRVCARLNKQRLGDEEAWETQYYPVPTSSTEVIVGAVGCVGVCIETWMGFDEARRVAMQKEVVWALLEDVGVL